MAVDVDVIVVCNSRISYLGDVHSYEEQMISVRYIYSLRP